MARQARLRYDQTGPRPGQAMLRHDREEGAIRSATRARGLAGGDCRDTKHCIVTGERGLAPGGCVTIQSLYRDKREVWLAKRVTIQTIVS